jgi:hypothetical protein
VLEALGRVSPTEGAFTLGIARRTMILEGAPVPSLEGPLLWLCEHLHERGIASLTLPAGIEPEDLVAFLYWLARLERGTTGRAPPASRIGVAFVDYGLARFEDRAAAEEVVRDTTRVWRAFLGGLTAGWYAGDAGAQLDDPGALAQAVSAEVARHEGVGGAAIAARVVAAGVPLGGLPDPIRRAVKRKLAAFVSLLSEDLRGEILRVDARSSRRKVELLTELADEFPDTTLMEVLADLDLAAARFSHAFIGLVGKLVGLAAREPLMRDLAEAKLASLGLQPGLPDAEPDDVKKVLRELLESRSEDRWNPDDYQNELDALAASPRGPGVERIAHGMVDPRDRGATLDQVSDIALRLLMDDPGETGAPLLVARLQRDAERLLESRRFDRLFAQGETIRDLAGRAGELPAETLQAAEEYLASLRRPEFLARILDAVEESAEGASPAVLGLFVAGGPEAADAGLLRVASRPEGAPKDRLVEVLVRLDAEVLSAAVGRLRGKGRDVQLGVIRVLGHPEVPLGSDLAASFVGNRDPLVRAEALKVAIRSESRPAHLSRWLERALGDPDATVVSAGMDELESKRPASGPALLRDFIRAATGTADSTPLVDRAIALLGRLGTPDARRALADLLDERRKRLGVQAVRLSMRIARVLDSFPDTDEATDAALRRFDRSTAGWFAWVLGPEPAAPEEQSQ